MGGGLQDCSYLGAYGSQYTSQPFQNLLKSYKMRSSMGDVGACWDNAVVERFFGSLKHDWILKIHQPTREHLRQDVTEYMRYYNTERLHSSNGDLSPVQYENNRKRRYNYSLVSSKSICQSHLFITTGDDQCLSKNGRLISKPTIALS